MTETIQRIGVEFEDPTPDYTHKDAVELEGECTSDQAESTHYHYDSSVEVCGNNEDSDCDCSIECECDRCYRCEDCGESESYCTCTGCLRCHDCEEDEDDCECNVKTAFDPECSDCKEDSRVALEKIACSSHRMEAFYDHSGARCIMIGNASLECDYECGCEIDHDGCDRGGNRDGEMVSPPLETRELTQWIRDNTPVRTNNTCGSHRHRSLKRMKYYSILMNKSFMEYLINRLRVWGNKVGVRKGSALFKRLDGDVHWCKAMYDGYNQINTEGKEDCRYRTVNYCWKLHSTVEIRVLPAFQDVELTISAQKELGSIMDDYITNNINSLSMVRSIVNHTHN